MTMTIANALTITMLILGAMLPLKLNAGGWSGNGGELLEDSQNPWFIIPLRASKSPIPYCIIHDAEHFSTPLASIKLHIRNALQYWWDEFSSAEFPTNLGLGKILVATESFIEKNCNDTDINSDIPLKFQFGKLLEYQLEEFKKLGKDPKRLTAISIRESYDTTNLKGRGFIYFAADSGPLKLEGQGIIEKPWIANDQNRFALILKHELGHIFGIPHIGERTEIMGAGFPEFLVQKDIEDFAWRYPTRIFRKPWGNQSRPECLDENASPLPFEFYYFPSHLKCLEYRFYSDGFEVFGSEKRNSPKTKVGTTIYVQSESTSKSIVKLWLPKEQTVFNDVPAMLFNVLGVADSLSYRFSGSFESKLTGDTRKLVLSINPSGYKIDGVFEERSQLMLDLHRGFSRGFR